MNSTEAPPRPAAPQPASQCPICGSPLASDQDWCLQCGAAARTRLATTPRWQVPLAAVLVVAALALAVLAGALVKLARDTGPAPTPITITAPAAGAATPPGATTAPATTGAPGTGASTTP